MGGGKIVNVKKSQVQKIVDKALLKSKVVEHKRHRGAIDTTISTTPSPLPLLNGLTVGVGDLDVRVGDVITLSKFQIMFSNLLADTTNVIRMIIFSWNDNNVTAPVASDILDDSASNVTQIYGPVNEDNLKSKRFTIWYDKKIFLNATRNYVGGRFTKNFKKPHQVTYSGGSSAIARGMPYLMLISDSSAVSHPAFKAYYSTHYIDL